MPTIAIAAEAAFLDETAAAAPVTVSATGFVFQFRSLASCAWGASLSRRRSRCFPTIDPKRRGQRASELRSAIGSAFISGFAMKTRSRGSACASSSPVYA
jgi:hypothetical protein